MALYCFAKNVEKTYSEFSLVLMALQFVTICIYQSSYSCTRQCSKIRVHLQIHVFIEISAHCRPRTETNECNSDCHAIFVSIILICLMQFESSCVSILTSGLLSLSLFLFRSPLRP